MKLILTLFLIFSCYRSTECSDEFILAKNLVEKLRNVHKLTTTDQLSEIFYKQVSFEDMAGGGVITYNLEDLLENQPGHSQFSFQSQNLSTYNVCYDVLPEKGINRKYNEIKIVHNVDELETISKLLTRRENGTYLIEKIVRWCRYKGTPDCAIVEHIATPEQGDNMRRPSVPDLRPIPECFNK